MPKSPDERVRDTIHSMLDRARANARLAAEGYGFQPTASTQQRYGENLNLSQEDKFRQLHPSHAIGLEPSDNPLVNFFLNPGDLAGASNVSHAMGPLIGKPEMFGDMGKKAKNLLDEWKNLGLKDMKLSDAYEYLQLSVKDILSGHPTAMKIQQAGGEALGHIPTSTVENALRAEGPFGGGPAPLSRDTASYTAAPDIADPRIDTGVGRVPAPPGAGPNVPGLPPEPPPQMLTPEMLTGAPPPPPGAPPPQAFPATIGNQGPIPVSEAPPPGLLPGVGERRMGLRRESRPGTGRRASDIGNPYREAAPYTGIDAGAPEGNFLPGVQSPLMNPPPNMTQNMRQFEPQSYMDDMLKATGDWEEASKRVAQAMKAQGMSKDKAVDLMSEMYSHENPRIGSYIKKHWGD